MADNNTYGGSSDGGGVNDDVAFNISQDDAFSSDLGIGDDVVEISADDSVEQVRLTFTSAEVGNGVATDSNTLANQDGGLAVRVQAEDGSGALVGPVSRFDDEGITFESDGTFTYDVRDLVSGVERGAFFDTVQLGTLGADLISERFSKDYYYINGGMGDDRIIGGTRNDFLVGGAGNDMLSDGNGNDSFIGGGGNDEIFGGAGNDTAIVNLALDGSDATDLGKGDDIVNVGAPATATQIRLTFTSIEVGNGVASDSNTMLNQDGGLAVRLQAEDGSDNVTGLVSRYDDEGITFVSTTPGVTFDVRDLVSGVQRGGLFNVVELGTVDRDRFNESGESDAYYINAGMGNDKLIGGLNTDFLVGGIGADRINGRQGNDSLLGGADADVFVFGGQTGTDQILDFVSGTDKIDLSAFDIDFGDVQTSASGTETLLSVNTDADIAFEFQVRLINGATPVEADFIFA